VRGDLSGSPFRLYLSISPSLPKSENEAARCFGITLWVAMVDAEDNEVIEAAEFKGSS
jgi:hypothetical protein